MKLPRAIDIMGNKWKIRVRKKLELDGSPALGLCDYEERVLYIQKGASTEMLESFFHECGHALIYELGLWTTDFGDMEDIEEVLVEGFSRWLVKSFKISPK